MHNITASVISFDFLLNFRERILSKAVEDRMGNVFAICFCDVAAMPANRPALIASIR